MDEFKEARELLKEFKGNSYMYGQGALEKTGDIASSVGKNAALIYTKFPGIDTFLSNIKT